VGSNSPTDFEYLSNAYVIVIVVLEPS
jgi:hypothetical protein